MSEPTLRGARIEDAAEIAAVMAAAEAVDRTEEHYNLEDVVEELENPMIDPARDWLLVEAEGRIVAHSRLLPFAPADGTQRVYIDGTVHPDHRRQGIGTRLLPVTLERAAEHARERGARPRVMLSALSTDTATAALAARVGLREHRWTFTMAADPAAAPEPPALPEGYTLETWEGIVDDEIRRAHNRAFVPHPDFTPSDAVMWTQWVSGARSYRPALSLLARDEAGAIAAYLQSCEYDATEQLTGVREAYVAKVGTLPEHGRRGLAGTLLRHALSRCAVEGYARVTLDVDSENPTGALGIYQRAGFTQTQRWTTFLHASG